MAVKIGKPKVRGPKTAKMGEVVKIKTMIKHPMETGLRKDDDGNPIPAHHIEKIEVEYLGKTIIRGTWTGAVSKNPFFVFYLKVRGDGEVKVTWKDNQGGVFSATAPIKVA